VQIALSNSELLTFSEIQDGGRRHLVIIKSCKFGTFRHVNSVVLELYSLYQIWFKYRLFSLRPTHLCSGSSFDDATRINYRFRLLVT